MRTPEDWFENVWLPSPKDDASILAFIVKVQQNAYLDGVRNALNTLNKERKKNDPN